MRPATTIARVATMRPATIRAHAGSPTIAMMAATVRGHRTATIASMPPTIRLHALGRGPTTAPRGDSRLLHAQLALPQHTGRTNSPSATFCGRLSALSRLGALLPAFPIGSRRVLLLAHPPTLTSSGCRTVVALQPTPRPATIGLESDLLGSTTPTLRSGRSLRATLRRRLVARRFATRRFVVERAALFLRRRTLRAMGFFLVAFLAFLATLRRFRGFAAMYQSPCFEGRARFFDLVFRFGTPKDPCGEQRHAPRCAVAQGRHRCDGSGGDWRCILGARASRALGRGGRSSKTIRPCPSRRACAWRKRPSSRHSDSSEPPRVGR